MIAWRPRTKGNYEIKMETNKSIGHEDDDNSHQRIDDKEEEEEEEEDTITPLAAKFPLRKSEPKVQLLCNISCFKYFCESIERMLLCRSCDPIYQDGNSDDASDIEAGNENLDYDDKVNVDSVDDIKDNATKCVLRNLAFKFLKILKFSKEDEDDEQKSKYYQALFWLAFVPKIIMIENDNELIDEESDDERDEPEVDRNQVEKKKEEEREKKEGEEDKKGIEDKRNKEYRDNNNNNSISDNTGNHRHGHHRHHTNHLHYRSHHYRRKFEQTILSRWQILREHYRESIRVLCTVGEIDNQSLPSNYYFADEILRNLHQIAAILTAKRIRCVSLRRSLAQMLTRHVATSVVTIDNRQRPTAATAQLILDNIIAYDAYICVADLTAMLEIVCDRMSAECVIRSIDRFTIPLCRYLAKKIDQLSRKVYPVPAATATADDDEIDDDDADADDDTVNEDDNSQNQFSTNRHNRIGIDEFDLGYKISKLVHWIGKIFGKRHERIPLKPLLAIDDDDDDVDDENRDQHHDRKRRNYDSKNEDTVPIGKKRYIVRQCRSIKRKCMQHFDLIFDAYFDFDDDDVDDEEPSLQEKEEEKEEKGNEADNKEDNEDGNKNNLVHKSEHRKHRRRSSRRSRSVSSRKLNRSIQSVD